MTRQEFLDELRTILAGEISAEATMDAYRYYSNYIDEEINKGKREEDVIEELGKPSLIAKSIIAAASGERDADVEYTEDGRTKKVYRSKTYGQTRETKDAKETKESKTFRFDLNAWYAKLIGVLLLLLLIVVVFLVIKVGVFFLVTFGIPILIFLGILYIIMYFMKE